MSNLTSLRSHLQIDPAMYIMYICAVCTWILFALAKRPFMMIYHNQKLKVDLFGGGDSDDGG
jgi:hypothetical protein